MLGLWGEPTLVNRKYFEWAVPPLPRQEPRHSRAKLTMSRVSGWPGL